MLKKLISRIGNFYGQLVESTWFNLVIFFYFISYYISSILLVGMAVAIQIYSREQIKNFFVIKFLTLFIHSKKMFSAYGFDVGSIVVMLFACLMNFSLPFLCIVNFQNLKENFKNHRSRWIFWIILNCIGLISCFYGIDNSKVTYHRYS